MGPWPKLGSVDVFVLREKYRFETVVLKPRGYSNELSQLIAKVIYPHGDHI